MITCSGVITNPSGNPVPNLQITITSKYTSTVLEHVELVVVTGADGSYSFPLENGHYSVTILFGMEEYLGDIYVDADTVSSTLNNLLKTTEVGSGIKDALTLFQQLKDDAQKAANDASAQVGLAQQEVTKAQQEVSKAQQEVAKATTQANKAKASADKAAQVAGLENVAQAIDTALDEIKIYAMRKSEFLMQAAVRAALYDNNSGFLNLGMNYPQSQHVVADGLVAFGDTLPNLKNSFVLGPAAADSAASGNSRTVNPVVVSNGIEIHIENVNSSSANTSKIDLREAENGTRTFNSSTGVLTEHASTEEAFAGSVGVNYASSFTALTGCVASGKTLTFKPTGGSTAQQARHNITWANGGASAYHLEFTAEVTSGSIQVVSYGVGNNDGSVYSVTKSGRHVVDFVPNSPSGAFGADNILAFYNGPNIDFDGVISDIQLRPASERVLGSTQDFSSLEHWFEIISADGGHDGHLDIMRPNGSVQYGKNTYAGITLQKVSSLGIDQKYSAFHDEDDTTDGYVAHWSQLSKPNQISLLLDPINCLFYDDSINKIVQANCNRFRSIRGLGNKWGGLAFDNTSGNLFYTWPKKAITPRGKRQAPMSDLGSYEVGYYKVNTNAGGVGFESIGHAQALSRNAQPSATLAYEGRCYLLPVGRIQRHSQGVYEPTHCPEGCRAPFANNGAGGVGDFTHPNSYKFLSKADCYDIGKNQAVGGNKVNGYSGVIGNTSGRIDKYKYFDAIYPDMIIEDMRNDLRKGADERTRIRSRNESVGGVKRGYGRVPFCIPTQSTEKAASGITGRYIENFDQRLEVGDFAYVQTTSGFVKKIITGRSASNKSINWSGGLDVPDNCQILTHSHLEEEYNELPYSNLTCKVETFKTMFPMGCAGEWIPDIRDAGVARDLTRKAKQTGSKIRSLHNNGTSWTRVDFVYTEASNTITTPLGNTFSFIPYASLSDITQPSKNKAPIGEVGDAWCGMYYGIEYGNRLIPSLIGKIAKNNSLAAGVNDFLKLKSYTINQGDGTLLKLPSAWGHLKRELIPFAAPAYESIACVALHTVVENKGWLYDQWHAIELQYNWIAPKNVAVGSTYAIAKGNRVRFASGLNNTEFNGTILRRIGNALPSWAPSASEFSGWIICGNKVVNAANGAISGSWEVATEPNAGWGDNGAVKVVDGESTAFNLNGVTVKVVCHRSKVPICIAPSNLRHTRTDEPLIRKARVAQNRAHYAPVLPPKN